MKRNSFYAKAMLALASLSVMLLATEVFLRTTKPYKTHRAAREMTNFRKGGQLMTGLFTLDPDMGFRPKLGGEGLYSQWGTLPNGYRLEKSEAVQRLLFVGDSVTHRGKIIAALEQVYGGEGFEYWNAGVESFTTTQELNFYRQYNSTVEPDHVILTFHLNDFQTTPVAFLDDHGHLTVYATHRPNRTINRALFEHLHLYRLWVGATTNRSRAWNEVSQEVRGALEGFQEALAPDVAFTVIIFPILSPFEAWTEIERRSYDEIRRILEELRIRHFDLTPVLERALSEHITVREDPTDPWHPNDAYAGLAATQLHQDRLFEVE